MNEILQAQKIIFEVLKTNNIKITSFANTNGQYPIIKFAEASKIIEDDFTRQIFVNLAIVSNKQSNVEVLNICQQVEKIFANKNLLNLPQIEALNLDILPHIVRLSVVQSNIFQDDTSLFTAKLLIKLVAC